MTASRKKIWRRLLEVMQCTKRSGTVRSLAVIATGGFFLGLLAFSFAPPSAAAADQAAKSSDPSRSSSGHEAAAAPPAIETQPVGAPHPKRATFEREHKSRNVQDVADWVVDSSDNRGMPFVVVDKVDAKVFVFDADGRLRGAAPALLGLARGDDSIPGIGDLKMSDVRPDQRTTPAGRFVAFLGRNFYGKDILWVDYDLAVSLHRVVTNNPKERRLQRLATPTPLDNRISYGCINVPVAFFNKVVSPTFTGTYGVVYVLPETRPISECFASYYDVESRWKTSTAAHLDEGERTIRLQ